MNKEKNSHAGNSGSWQFVGIYGKRRTAESVADVTRDKYGCKTRIRLANHRNYVVEKRKNP